MKKKDFDNIFKKGKAIPGKFIFLKALKNNLNNNQFGIIVSTKISKKAVIRNKIKRQLREIIKQTDIRPGFDIVIVTKLEIINKNYQEIKNELEDLFKNI